jgi:tetratricopeptide (TPR) repeat protein
MLWSWSCRKQYLKRRMLKFKFQTSIQIPNPRARFFRSGIWLLIASWFVIIGFFTYAYALNLDSLRVYFLNGEYKACISEGEKILAGASSSKDLDEVYYLLGLSYLKDGNYLRASDIFEIIINEYRRSEFREEARMGLGDSYFARGDYQKALNSYKGLLQDNSRSKLKPALYYRLSQLGKRTGDSRSQQEYLLKLKDEFPQSLEALINKDFLPGSANISMSMNKPVPLEAKPATNAPDVQTKPDLFVEAGTNHEIITGAYSVQVGAFSSLNNARSLTFKLKAQGYGSYISEAASGNKKIYKVRVGGYPGRTEAKAAEKKLQLQGYSTKIIP